MPTVLIIEDNQDIRENTVEILELNGFKVASASNGAEGIAQVIAAKPDVVLCDIMMPGLDGYQVLQQLKNNSTTARIPFIYVTASTEKSEVKRAIDLGADGYIRKPYETDELIAAILKCIR